MSGSWCWQALYLFAMSFGSADATGPITVVPMVTSANAKNVFERMGASLSVTATTAVDLRVGIWPRVDGVCPAPRVGNRRMALGQPVWVDPFQATQKPLAGMAVDIAAGGTHAGMCRRDRPDQACADSDECKREKFP
jgi:hypothetical protein